MTGARYGRSEPETDMMNDYSIKGARRLPLTGFQKSIWASLGYHRPVLELLRQRRAFLSSWAAPGTSHKGTASVSWGWLQY